MLDSTIVALGWAVSNYLIGGVAPQAAGNENMTAAPSGTFRTKQGLLNIAANKQEQFELLATIIGRSDLVKDPRFAERESRKRNRSELNDAINAALQSRTSVEWEEALATAGVPAARIFSVPEALEHPQVRHRRLVQDLDVMTHGHQTTKVVRAGFRLSDCEPTARRAPPTLGEHTVEILTSLGVDSAAIAELRVRQVV
jgi:crotonobetainyl-CoA:carnitine CoA-transferase CaiB-like acyl-CoA transferase